MGNIGRNLKVLRKNKSITQQQLADYLSIKRPVIGAYEEERAEPKMEMLQKMASFFNISLEDFAGTTLTDEWIKEKEKYNGLNTAKDTDKERAERAEILRQSGARILSITTGEDELENIEMVPIRASAGYLNGYADTEFISTLPRFRLPMLKGGTFRAFELKGESMLPLLPGTYIIGEFVDNWSLIKNGDTYVVLSSTEGIVYKRVQNKLKQHSVLVLSSDNPEYTPYQIEAIEILEVWKAKAYISMQFPIPN